MPFSGVPHSAAAFYAGLEENNSRGFWEANRERYEKDVRGPMTALLAELSEEFGTGRVFRPHRDVRFSQDKSPYKTHQGIFVPVAPRTGWYAEVSADGFRVGGGCYHLEPAALAAFRRGIDGPRGARLETVVDQLAAAGWEVVGESLRTAPRGYPRDHPRIGLLRRRSLAAMRWIEDGDVVTTDLLVEEVRGGWRRLRPLVEWLREVVEGR
ncbi:DUF2461 domain-containing protein [Ornithinimicrobium sp. W1665]|uniref:DUF2461 domain-containing protein n=1 Tax=Ornithinimicrobium sp. W1665 TaxID=3416666 RepID=UPI003CF08098